MSAMGGGEIKDRMLVALPTNVGAGDTKRELERFQKKWPGIEITYKPADNMKDPLDPKIYKDKTILFTLFAFPSSLEDCPDMELIHLASAGSNQVSNNPIYKDSDITLTTSSGVHGPQISEWVIMTALVHSHHYNETYEQQKEHYWGGFARSSMIYDKVGQRVGILGYGSIGRQVGRLCKSMGMEVLAFTATPKDTPEKRRDDGYIVPGTGDPEGEVPSEWYSGLDKDSLHDFLNKDIDMLVLTLPLTDDTRHMLSTREFEILSKRKTLVSNISRGSIIDQPALIEALKKDQLRGACLDVTDPEPLPADSELWDMKNVIISPHMSGLSASYIERALAVLDLNLNRRAEGKPLVNVVNRKRGY